MKCHRKTGVSGLLGPYFGLLDSYLSERKKFLSIGTVQSETRAMKAVFLRSSRASTGIMFLIFVIDLPLVCKSRNTTLFADDETSFYDFLKLGHQSSEQDLQKKYTDFFSLLNTETMKYLVVSSGKKVSSAVHKEEMTKRKKTVTFYLHNFKKNSLEKHLSSCTKRMCNQFGSLES